MLLVAMLVALGWWLQREAPADAPVVASDQRTTGPTSVPLPLPPPGSKSLPAFLPAEAEATLALIEQGGPFPSPQDGEVFGNREGRLPPQPRGFYREYTVRTPGIAHRGARRIVTGGQPPRLYYYTADHYESFRSFELNR